jgi:hypothetical protein
LVEAQLRKLKKSGAHIAASGGSGGAPSTASSRNASRAGTPVPLGHGANVSPVNVPALLDQAFAASIPTAVAGTPYLQSGRLMPPTLGGAGGINKSLRLRMDEVLQEMGIREKPLASKRVCDLFDTVRRDTLTLLILQRTALQKEGLLASKRLLLAKRGGNVQVVDEETLLGVPSVPFAAAAVRHNSGVKVARSGSKVTKTTPPVGSAHKAKMASKPKTVGSDAVAMAIEAKKVPPPTAAASQSSASITTNNAVSTGIKQAARKQPAVPGVKRKRKAGETGSNSPSLVKTSDGAAVLAHSGAMIPTTVAALSSSVMGAEKSHTLQADSSTPSSSSAMVGGAAEASLSGSGTLEAKAQSKKRTKKSAT